MKVPIIFKGKTCDCGSKIEDRSVREIGIDFSTEKFLLRFTCPTCGFKGRLVFETADRKIEDLCAEIANMTEASGQTEEETNEEAVMVEGGKRTREEIFCVNFDQNEIACLFIPDWTEESSREFTKYLEEV